MTGADGAGAGGVGLEGKSLNSGSGFGSRLASSRSRASASSVARTSRGGSSFAHAPNVAKANMRVRYRNFFIGLSARDRTIIERASLIVQPN